MRAFLLNMFRILLGVRKNILPTFYDTEEEIKQLHITSVELDESSLINQIQYTQDFGEIKKHERFYELRTAIRNLIEDSLLPNLEFFPVVDIQVLSNSKSKGCEDLKSFAQNVICRDALHPDRYSIKFETEDDFLRNIKRIEERFERTAPTLYISEWNGKNRLDIIDKSHHIAAVYRQCKDQDKNYSIRCHIVRRNLNISSLQYILDNYYALILNYGFALNVWHILYTNKIETYLSGMEDIGAVYISKELDKSRRIYSLLVEEGGYDLNNYFSGLVINNSSTRENEKNLGYGSLYTMKNALYNADNLNIIRRDN